MKKRFLVFGEIQKVEAQEDGTLRVSGVASSETPDGVGEIVKASAMKDALPDYMKFGAVREMHQPIAAGTAISIEVDAAGITQFEAHVVDKGSIDKVNAGVLKGFSIGGKVTSRNDANKNIITGIKLTEISLVDVPCNPDATFSLVKFEEGEMPEEPVKKGLWTVQDFAGILQSLGWIASDTQWEAECEGDASGVPAKLREWLAAGATIFQEMAAEEVSEMLSALKPKGEMETITAAAPAGDLAKGGKKFSAATKSELDGLHKAAVDAHAELGKCMKALGDVWTNEDKQDDEEEAAKVAATELQKSLTAKTSELTEALAKTTVEKDALQKSLDAISADLKTTKDALEKAECDLKAKGILKSVPVEKTADTQKLTQGEADAPNAADPLACMKAVQAMPVSLIFNRPANLG